MIRLVATILILIFVFGCNRTSFQQNEHISSSFNHPAEGRGAILLTQIERYQELNSLFEIQYSELRPVFKKVNMVSITHQNPIGTVESILTDGVSQTDLLEAQAGGVMKKIALLLRSPYAISQRNNLQSSYNLARNRSDLYGESDVAFYGIAVQMMDHIRGYDKSQIAPIDLSEKGYINTINHIVGQAFVTTLFSEKLADFIADIHERYNMPELTNGQFSEEQIDDIDFGATDNYVDMINNEWGQKLGAELKMKFDISRSTIWTEQLMTDYLNDIQLYLSHAFGIGFLPFQTDDFIVRRFTEKVNFEMHE